MTSSSKAQSGAGYPSAARISDSECYPAYTASLKCLEVYNADKSKCQEHFDIYKECRKKRGKHVWNAIGVDLFSPEFFRGSSLGLGA